MSSTINNITSNNTIPEILSENSLKPQKLNDSIAGIQIKLIKLKQNLI